MSRIVWGDSVGEWVAMQINGFYARGASQAIGLERDGRIVAGIIYEDYNGRSVTCHLAIQGRITREFLHVISSYAFTQMEASKIIAPAYSDNERSIRMLVKMGFELEGEIRDAQPQGSILLFTMTKEQCPYLKPRYAAGGVLSANR